MTDSRRVQIVDQNGAARWHPIWDDNPRIAKPGEVGDFRRISNGPNCRPYIVGKTSMRWTWKPFDCMPGEIYLTLLEQRFGLERKAEIVIEPNIKPRASPNKQWGQARWREFVAIAADVGYSLTQLGAPGTRLLAGVNFIETPDFRRACAVLAHAKAYIGPDGGMHHAAAALGVPAIVIRGAFINQACTGYLGQRNLFTGRGLGCGIRVPCPCCARAMAAITPQMVLGELTELLDGPSARPALTQQQAAQ